MRCPRRLTLHHHAQRSVDARLVALALTLEPIEHVLIQTNGQLLFRRRPSQRCLFEKGSCRAAECPNSQSRRVALVMITEGRARKAVRARLAKYRHFTHEAIQ